MKESTMKHFQRLYVKSLIKNPALFYVFLGVFVAVFLSSSLSLKLDIVRSYPSEASGCLITIFTDDNVKINDTRVYLYKNRNERIYKTEIDSYENSEGKTILKLVKNVDSDISGDVTVDIIIGQQSLLKRIFVKAGKN
ncbi:MAG: hypothetical protein PHC69_09445 [Ruminiclostridium sp.]|nr:hypothetical protein [Ruminiclostridium sp.]